MTNKKPKEDKSSVNILLFIIGLMFGLLITTCIFMFVPYDYESTFEEDIFFENVTFEEIYQEALKEQYGYEKYLKVCIDEGYESVTDINAYDLMVECDNKLILRVGVNCIEYNKWDRCSETEYFSREVIKIL